MTWSHVQDQAFTNVKTELTKPTVLTLFNLNAELKVSADALLFGLRAIFLQKNSKSW